MKRIESSWSEDVRAGSVVESRRAGSVVDSKRAGSMGISLGGIIVLCALGCQRISWGSESKRRNPLRSIMSLAKLCLKGSKSVLYAHMLYIHVYVCACACK